MQQVSGYEKLDDVLARAYRQASAGKGVERHAAGEPFHEQPMQIISDLVGVGFCIGQAIKKAHESQRLPHDRAVAELLGAINYLAGAVIYMEQRRQPTLNKLNSPANDNQQVWCTHCVDKSNCMHLEVCVIDAGAQS
jgi:hypothetical protein